MGAKGDAVAVIVVHGVAGPDAGVTAREVASLLQISTGAYAGFKESRLELKVTDIQCGSAASQHAEEKSPWYVRTRLVSLQAGDPEKEKEPETFDVAFTREAVTGAKADATLIQYQTVVLSGERLTENGVQQVDVYEMYWADLSRLRGWFGRVLGEFHQILFHLATVGQKTVELAWLRSGKEQKALLAPLLGAQTIAGGLLTVALPLFNLALLFAIIPAVAGFVTNSTVRAGLCGAAVACLIGYFLCRRIWSRQEGSSSDHDLSYRRGWALTISVASSALLGAGAGCLIYLAGAPVARMLLLAIFSVGALAAHLALTRKLLARRKPGSLPSRIVNGIAIGTWAALLAIGIHRFPMIHEHDEIRVALFIAEGVYVLISAAWSGFIVAGWLAVAFGFRASRLAKDESTSAAVWTGRVGLFIPAALLFLVNVVAWHLVYQLAVSRMLQGVTYDRSLFSGISERLICSNLSWGTHCAERLLSIAYGPAFAWFLVCLLLAVALLLVALLPSILYESKPVWRGERPLDASDERASATLGNWLDSGWFVLRAAGYIFVAAMLLVPVLQYLEAARETAFLDDLGLGGKTLVPWLGSAIVGGTLVAVALRDYLSKGITRAIGILFDVDNWLKERPIERNPRGRILLRYIALLRHIRRAGYQRIVIVAHSQGSVVTADLLRFLSHHRDVIDAGPAEARRIRLMTLGSPLRQLYGLRFPDLYGWARAQQIDRNYPSREALFGVERWINCYRSGDYVGRFFWTPDDQWKPRDQPPTSAAAEFCLVAGAHTHYFDQTALDVGRVIDGEIAGDRRPEQLNWTKREETSWKAPRQGC